MRFSPLGLLHVIVGFIGWGSYGTCLAGVCLIINGGVYIEATRRMEAGDGGRAVYEKVGLRFKSIAFSVYWFNAGVLFHGEWCIRQTTLIFFYHTLQHRYQYLP